MTPERKPILFAAILACCVVAVGCGPSEAEKERQAQAKRDECIANAKSSCQSACLSDPEGVYCVMLYENVVGSGCTRELDSLSYEEKVKKCQSRACSAFVRDAIMEC